MRPIQLLLHRRSKSRSHASTRGSAVSAVARHITIIVPAFAALLCTSAIGSGPPKVLSGYRDLADPAGAKRTAEHAGVDFGGGAGDLVLAAAEGFVQTVFPHDSWCANGIRLWHEEFNRFTHYCHLSEIKVGKFDRVKRGQPLGSLGIWRQPGGPPSKIAMLHFEVTDYARLRGDGNLSGTYDPIPMIAGCFDPSKKCPPDRFVLTYPLSCREGR